MTAPEPPVRPVLALVAGPGTTGAVRGLVRALSAVADVRALGRCGSRPAAVLATSAAPDTIARVPAGTPVAVWIEAVARPLPSGMIAVGPGAGVNGVRVHPLGIDLADLLPVGPVVRARWRRRFDLPADWVVDADAVGSRDRTTALALCSAAVASEGLVTALGLGTPTVTSEHGARLIGAEDDVHVVVARPGRHPMAEAADLAADLHRAARLSAAGRALVERKFDLGAGARRLAERLGLTEPAGGDVVVLGARLTELGTPAASRIRLRAATATAVLTGAPS